MSSFLGMQLKQNMERGVPTRTKSVADYTGYAMAPCGDFGIDSQSKPPWRSSARSRFSSPTTLHDEVLDFMRYIEPTQQEKAMRQDLITRFKSLVTSFQINATVQPVGSYVTGLYLPTSDIDMVITFQGQRSYSTYSSRPSDLQSLLCNIKASGFASKVDDVLHASIPLIRITDKTTGIQIDLTAADLHSIKATKAVQKWLAYNGEIVKVLVTVVKMFLSIRNCGTTYTGGVNSYVLVWMVVAWVNLEWKNSKTATIPAAKTEITSLTDAFDRLYVRESSTSALLATSSQNASRTAPPIDYGEVLMGFFKFYGMKTIPYTPKFITQRYLLSIFDPASSTLDMGSKAYGIKHVQASFEEAYKRILIAKKRHGVLISCTSGGLLDCVLRGDFKKFEEKRKRAGKS